MGICNETRNVVLPKNAVYKEIVANISKINNAGWRLGNTYAAGFKASMNQSQGNIDIKKKEKGIGMDLGGVVTLGEVSYKNNKENTTGET